MHFSQEQLAAFFLFATVASITPGPNNAMMLASGVNFGFARSIPPLLGIVVGFTVMILLMGFGFRAVFIAAPELQVVLKYAGAAYLAWLAWKIARAAPVGVEGVAVGRPMTSLAAALFQWVNPKAWVLAVGAVTAYLPESYGWIDVALLAGIFGLTGAVCTGAWTAFGVGMRRLLKSPRSVRAFNIAAATLLIASLYPMVT